MKHRLLIALLGLLVLSGCSRGRDLSTPSTRLSGHWVASNGTDHYYFGSLDSSRNGSFAVKFGKIQAIHQGYKIISEIPDEEQVVAMVTFSDGDNQTNIYHPAKDGRSMKMELQSKSIDGGTSTFVSDVTYVDDKTQP